MRTNVDIDDDLMKQAMKATGQPTKKATIEAALKDVIKRSDRRNALNELWGIGWNGDLEEMRLERDKDQTP